jgi:arylsulfatase A-like enzyme
MVATLATLLLTFLRNDVASPPNIVFILIDDLGWRDVGFMGSRYYETPNIDKLARQGLVFTNAYANASSCVPSRACILSGQYTPRHVYSGRAPDPDVAILWQSKRRRVDSHKDRRQDAAITRKLVPLKGIPVLPEDIVTLTEALKSVGYLCACIGKWHIGTDPTTQGFDINIGGSILGSPYSYFSPYNIENLQDGPRREYLTDRLTEEAVRFIKANKDNRFFLYLAHYAVHSPNQSKRNLQAKYETKKPSLEQWKPKYAAMIESVDESVGRIMRKLEELDIAENTALFFFSDNGGVGGRTSMKPLRGSKGMYYEGGIRVPAVAMWPGKIINGSTCDTPIMGIDFYPTILEMTGTKTPDGKILDGVSLLPLFKGDHILERPLFWHFPIYNYGDAEGARDSFFRTRPGTVVRYGDWKLHEYFEDGSLELYNLREDIGEKENLVVKMPNKAKELHDIMEKWRSMTKAPVPTKLNPQYNPNALSEPATEQVSPGL